MKEINWQIKEYKQLTGAFLALRGDDEARRFLRDLMTAQEIKELASRLEAARLLENKIQYNDIVADTGLSSTTVARIAKWLRGPLGGYRLILSRLHHTHSQISVGKGLTLHS